LTFQLTHEVQREAENLLSDAEYQVSSRRVLELVRRGSECSAYDCKFVALAMELGVKLVTMGEKVLRAFPDVAVALTAYKTP
jgi:predicted nucleic acid-binding protein